MVGETMMQAAHIGCRGLHTEKQLSAQRERAAQHTRVRAIRDEPAQIVRHRFIAVPKKSILNRQHLLGELLSTIGKDEGLHDLVRALNDAMDSVVAPEPLELVLRHVALTAHYLHGIIDHTPAILRAEDFRYGGLNHDVFITSVEHARHHVKGRVESVGVGRHACDSLLDELEICKRTSELVPRLDPLDALIHRLLRASGNAGRKRAAAVIKT